MGWFSVVCRELPFVFVGGFQNVVRGWLGGAGNAVGIRLKRGSCQAWSYLTVEIFSTILPRISFFAVEIVEKIQPLACLI